MPKLAAHRPSIGVALAAALVCAVCATGRTVHAQPRETLPVDLPTALRLADERNLDIAIALATVDETTARAAQARLLAVPTLRAGSTIDRHHDNIQETSGLVVDVDRASRYTNFGAGLSVDIADAIYRPLAARRIRDASAAAADANRHRVFAQVAIAYLELARANGERTIVQRALDRANDLAALTSDYAEAGEGLPADAEMAAVQPLLLAQRAAATEARLVAASVELGRLLRLEPGVHPMPLDESVPLLTLLPDDDDVDALVARAVDARPESAQVEALVAAAEVDLTAEKKGLFIPNVSLNYTSGLFGGGPGSAIRNSGHRDDLTLTLYWQLDGFGLGNRARRDEREAQLRRAGFERARLRDAIAAEVRAAHAQLTSARAQLDLVAAAIERARAAYESHRTRIYDQQGLPLEALAAMQTLAAAELAELDARAAYSVAQVRLHTALGNPVEAR